MKTKLLFFFACMGVSLIMGCDQETASTSTGSDNAGFSGLLESYHQTLLQFKPLESTRAGEVLYNDQLPNEVTLAYRNDLNAFYNNTLKDLEKFDRNQLNTEDQMSYDILKWECEINLEEMEFHKHLFPLDQFNGLHLTMGQFAGGTSAQPFNSVRDYESWLVRLDKFAV